MLAEDPPAAEEESLEAPAAVDDLYYAVGGDVSTNRPLLTGDVLADVEIPGLEDGSSYAIVLTHPCSMRKDGVHLVERIFMARVRRHQEIPLEKWATTNFKVMPLPQLPGFDVDAAAVFNEAGLVRSDSLDISRRTLCLSEYGINLLQQRLVYHFTRFAVPTARLHRVSAQVFREVELHEEWVTAAVEGGADALTAQHEFHEWLRSSAIEGQATRQQRLLDEQQAAAVRRELRAAVKGRHGASG